ncbi:hypothetical protein V6N13_051349 [Hibiscus sabdariffa]
MKTLVWNCSWLGNHGSVQALRQFPAVNGPDLVFLCGTRLYKNKTGQVRRQLSMVGGLEVKWSDSCVGLMLLWQDTIQVTLKSYSQWHIDVDVDDGQFPFRFTGVYGSCYRDKKREVWELLDSLGQQDDRPWLIGEDLNEILDMSEKDGGRRRPRVDMDEFRDVLNRNGLWDIRPSTGWFTWQTGEIARVFMKERLDRFAATEGQRQWDTRKVLQVFTPADASKILQCPIANSKGDVLRWSHHLSGIYSTKSGHHWLAHREREYTDDSPNIWLEAWTRSSTCWEKTTSCVSRVWNL